MTHFNQNADFKFQESDFLNSELKLLNETPLRLKLPQRKLPQRNYVQWCDSHRTIANFIFPILVIFISAYFGDMVSKWSNGILSLIPTVFISVFIGSLTSFFISVYFSKVESDDFLSLLYLCIHPKTSQKMGELHQEGFIFTSWFVSYRIRTVVLKHLNKKDLSIAERDLRSRLMVEIDCSSYEQLMDFIFPPERVLAFKEKETMRESLPLGILKEMKARL